MKYLGLIPARGGSKRVPNKNIRIVNGKPLIYWSIKCALESKYIDYIAVSTDSDEIAKIAYESGANVIRRPPELGGDLISDQPVIEHALNEIDAENVVFLRPTSPIRIGAIIDKCIEIYEREKPDSFTTGFYNKEYEAFTRKVSCSQLEKGWFQNNGCVEIHKSDIILSGKPYGKKQYKHETESIYNYEIDTEEELIMIDALMRTLGVRA